MKTTPFTGIHIKLGAKMQPFAGFNMPVEYSGINDEHITVRNCAGVFDVSHMGEFWVKGPKASGFLQYITSNDIERLSDGMIQYSCLPNGRGGIVDDILVYCFDRESYMIVVNAANIQKDWEWCSHHAARHGIETGSGLTNASEETAQLAVQGPLAMRLIGKLTDRSVEQMRSYMFIKTEIAGVGDAIISTTGYTGAGGCEIYAALKEGPALWDAVFEAGREFGIKPAGLGARDTLRLEMGYCLYGNDIDETTSPIEAGLGWITKFSENNQFIDRDFLLKQKTEGPQRRLTGFIMQERGIPRTGYEIEGPDGTVVGKVTSGTMSPMLKTGIGMGYIKTRFATEGTEIKISVRNKKLRALVSRFPLYRESK